MSVFITVFSGVLVFVIGQIVVKLIIEPINDFKKERSKIIYDLVFYANKLANPKGPDDQEMVEVCKIMRQHSSMLHSATHLIPCYQYFAFIFGLPAIKNINEATSKLIYLSNGYTGVFKNQAILNTYAMQEVKIALGVPIPQGEMLDPDLKKEFIK